MRLPLAQLVAVLLVASCGYAQEAIPDAVPAQGDAGRATSPGAPRLVVFGELGYGWFRAERSFDTVFGRHGGTWMGGGGELRWRRAFAAVTVERFRRTGRRVFVFEDQVFDLGIPDTLTLTPVTVTAGYRHPMRRLTPYAGVGVGRYAIAERSMFATDRDNVSRGARSLTVLGGAERRLTRLVAAAFELRYTHVPDALGAGIAGLFGERSLSGTALHVKVVFGG